MCSPSAHQARQAENGARAGRRGCRSTRAGSTDVATCSLLWSGFGPVCTPRTDTDTTVKANNAPSDLVLSVCGGLPTDRLRGGFPMRSKPRAGPV